MEIALILCLAFSILAVVYVYVGYPILVAICARCFGRNRTPVVLTDDELPAISVLIAAYNEEAEIEARILNLLALDHPRVKCEILIASDGSSDRTNAIVREYADHGVRLLDFPERRGKSSVLNDAFQVVSHDIVVLSDANTQMDPGSLRSMASWFQDARIGVVCGRLVLTDPRTGRNVDSLYWKFETFLKKAESRLGALLGSNGGIYAIRKELFQPIPANTIVDDFVIPLQARQRTGCEIVYDRNAVACEETPERIRSEFHRRTRIGAGGFQSIGLLRGLLHPKHGWICFTFWSHKVLRWLCPFFLMTAFAANVFLASQPIFLALLLVQIAFYAVSGAAAWLPARPRSLRFLRLGTMFTSMNLALLFGFFRWLRGSQKAAWTRTARSTEFATIVEQPIAAAS